MVDRVLIKGGVAAAMQVSMPGFDVNSASLANMAFDARFANMHLVAQGLVYVNWETETFVAYGTTYATIPRVFCGFVPPSSSPNPDPIEITSPDAVLTSGSGTWLSLTRAIGQTNGISFYSGFQGVASDVRPFASTYFYYSAYR